MASTAGLSTSSSSSSSSSSVSSSLHAIRHQSATSHPSSSSSSSSSFTPLPTHEKSKGLPTHLLTLHNRLLTLSTTNNSEKNGRSVTCCGLTPRALVSKKKLRFIDQQNNVDLDLSYITDRIVAMGYPSIGIEAWYRNPAYAVRDFLEKRHNHHYRIWNLCIERGYGAASLGLQCEIERYSWYDHTPPPYALMRPLADSIENWLQAHQQNIAVIHCKAGKGRTGTIIAAYLLHHHYTSMLNQTLAMNSSSFSSSNAPSMVPMTTEEALQIFGWRRTRNGRGVTIPSQQRYVAYGGIQSCALYYANSGWKDPLPVTTKPTVETEPPHSIADFEKDNDTETTTTTDDNDNHSTNEENDKGSSSSSFAASSPLKSTPRKPVIHTSSDDNASVHTSSSTENTSTDSAWPTSPVSTTMKHDHAVPISNEDNDSLVPRKHKRFPSVGYVVSLESDDIEPSATNVKVIIHRDYERTLGFALAPDLEGRIIITEIKAYDTSTVRIEDAPAYVSPSSSASTGTLPSSSSSTTVQLLSSFIRLGDEVRSVNNENLRNLSFEAAINILRNTNDPLTLILFRRSLPFSGVPIQLPPANPEEYLHRISRGIGPWAAGSDPRIIPSPTVHVLSISLSDAPNLPLRGGIIGNCLRAVCDSDDDIDEYDDVLSRLYVQIFSGPHCRTLIYDTRKVEQYRRKHDGTTAPNHLFDSNGGAQNIRDWDSGNRSPLPKTSARTLTATTPSSASTLSRSSHRSLTHTSTGRSKETGTASNLKIEKLTKDLLTDARIRSSNLNAQPLPPLNTYDSDSDDDDEFFSAAEVSSPSSVARNYKRPLRTESRLMSLKRWNVHPGALGVWLPRFEPAAGPLAGAAVTWGSAYFNQSIARDVSVGDGSDGPARVTCKGDFRVLIRVEGRKKPLAAVWLHTACLPLPLALQERLHYSIADVQEAVKKGTKADTGSKGTNKEDNVPNGNTATMVNESLVGRTKNTKETTVIPSLPTADSLHTLSFSAQSVSSPRSTVTEKRNSTNKFNENGAYDRTVKDNDTDTDKDEDNDAHDDPAEGIDPDHRNRTEPKEKKGKPRLQGTSSPLPSSTDDDEDISSAYYPYPENSNPATSGLPTVDPFFIEGDIPKTIALTPGYPTLGAVLTAAGMIPEKDVSQAPSISFDESTTKNKEKTNATATTNTIIPNKLPVQPTVAEVDRSRRGILTTILTKNEIDGVIKDKKHRVWPEDMRLAITFRLDPSTLPHIYEHALH